MEFLLALGWVIPVGIALIGLVILFFIGLIFFRAWYRVAKADEALVIVGKTQRGEDGSSSRISVVTGGGAIVNPITQRAELISLRARQINVEPTAQSSNGVTVDVTGVALFKIGSEADQVRRAAERFASQDQAIEQFTREQLEGSLRGVVATLTVEELMRDRQRLSDQIADNIKGDLEAQGLILDSFQIQGVTDKNGYIDSLGAAEVERVKRDAEVARIAASREVKKRELERDEQNLVEQTQYDKNTAAAAAETGRARAHAQQAEALARAQAEQGVLIQQAENKQAQLDADVKRVADANLYERQRAADAEAYEQVKAAEAQAQIAAEDAKGTRLRAEADAEAIRLAGQAKADALQAEAEALARNQEALLAQRALDALPRVMAEFAKGYANVGSVTVLGGDSASSHLAGESAVGMRAMFDAVREATGLDLAGVIQGRAVGQGIGEAATAATPPSAAPVAPETRAAARAATVTEDEGPIVES